MDDQRDRERETDQDHKQDEDRNEEHEQKSCYEAIADLDVLRQRLQRTANTYKHIKNYQRFHDEIVRSLRDDPACAERIRPHLAERAYEAEAHARVLCDDTLATLNELRDSGQLEPALQRAAQRMSRIQESPVDALHAVRRGLREDWPELDTGFLDEAEHLFKQQGIRIRRTKGRNPAASIEVGGEVHDFTVSAAPRPGAPGGVTREEFFAGTNYGPLAPEVALLVPSDCHHRLTISPTRHDAPIDAYTTLVASLTVLREQMYHHARQMEEVGPSDLQGNAPIVAIAVALIIIGAALVIAGAVIEIGCAAGAWSGSVCDWGWVLLGFGVIFVAGGICVAVGACAFVVSLFFLVAA